MVGTGWTGEAPPASSGERQPGVLQGRESKERSRVRTSAKREAAGRRLPKARLRAARRTSLYSLSTLSNADSSPDMTARRYTAALTSGWGAAPLASSSAAAATTCGRGVVGVGRGRCGLRQAGGAGRGLASSGRPRLGDKAGLVTSGG